MISKAGWSAKASNVEERQIKLAGEEGEIQDGTQVFWKFSRCGKSNTEDKIENQGWAEGPRVRCE